MVEVDLVDFAYELDHLGLRFKGNYGKLFYLVLRVLQAQVENFLQIVFNGDLLLVFDCKLGALDSLDKDHLGLSRMATGKQQVFVVELDEVRNGSYCRKPVELSEVVEFWDVVSV